MSYIRLIGLHHQEEEEEKEEEEEEPISKSYLSEFDTKVPNACGIR
jgi:hypothetical protein